VASSATIVEVNFEVLFLCVVRAINWLGRLENNCQKIERGAPKSERICCCTAGGLFNVPATKKQKRHSALAWIHLAGRLDSFLDFWQGFLRRDRVVMPTV
jgi:hypothetical protein